MNNRSHSHRSRDGCIPNSSPHDPLASILAQCGHSDDRLIEVLHAIQQNYGYLERGMLRRVAAALKLPPSLVYGVASFYHAFRLEPPNNTVCSVCTGTACHLKGGTRLLRQLASHLAGNRSPITLDEVRCMGACGLAPLVRIDQGGFVRFHGGMDADTTQAAFANGHHPQGMEHLPPTEILSFATETAALLYPDSTGISAQNDTYATLIQVIGTMSPDEVCEHIAASGLRGRGGAGYPTGLKWQQVRETPGNRKYVVANGDEGDPGAFMDRTLMENDPHRLLEGMALAGYAVGADRGYVYVRGEYPLAAARLRRAIEEAESAGHLGRDIGGGRFSFTVRVRIGAGAFVCGEETALMASIMGRRGQPAIRPPYPAQRGLWGCPTLINNVETLACVPLILAQGVAAFRTLGSNGNNGSKIFSLSGDIARCGVVEVPLGTTLRHLLDAVGGVTGGNFKAAQTGGASGSCIPATHLDMPLDYETPREIGTIMGSGGIVILNDARCMVDLARFFMHFCSDESCGKCTPCRSGTRQALRILDDICSGTATEEYLSDLEELCLLMRDASLCGLGQSAPTVVLGTLRWYRHEYLAHLTDGCPCGVCQAVEVS